MPGFSVAPGYKGALPSKTFGPEIGFAETLQQLHPGLPLSLILWVGTKELSTAPATAIVTLGPVDATSCD